MRPVWIALTALSSALLLAEPLTARPDLLTKFQNDPFRKPEVDGCGICHVSAGGGGARTDFGNAFLEAGSKITPMMRTNFADRFQVPTTKLSDGSVFYFSDPDNQFVIVERNKQKVQLDFVALTAPKKEALPPALNRMTFFVTSKPMGNGGHLEGLAGADRHCQTLAEGAGAGDRRWRAYLSTSFEDKPLVNAGDRIGAGPWYNAKGMLVARGSADLHSTKGIGAGLALTEKGDPVPPEAEILTGSNPDGTAAIGANCGNWTSAGEGKAQTGSPSQKWNSGRTSRSCSVADLGQAGGLLYCFALGPR